MSAVIALFAMIAAIVVLVLMLLVALAIVYVVVRTDCAHAWVWAGLFRKIHQYAAPGADVVGNLVRRLEKKGWEVVE